MTSGFSHYTGDSLTSLPSGHPDRSQTPVGECATLAQLTAPARRRQSLCNRSFWQGRNALLKLPEVWTLTSAKILSYIQVWVEVERGTELRQGSQRA